MSEMIEKDDLIDENPDSANDSNDLGNESILNNKNTRMILGVFVVIIIGTLAYFFIKSQNEKKNIEASVAYSRIAQVLETGDEEMAMNGGKLESGAEVLGLPKFISKFSGTKQASLVSLYAGNILFNKGKYKEAGEYFEKALDGESKVILAGANCGLAACKEMSSNYNEAAELYEKAAELTDAPVLKPKYQYFAAICFEKVNNKDKAEKLYKSIINANQFSEFAGPSKVALERLGINFD